MKNYTLRKTNNPQYGYVVFATSYQSPFEHSKEIERLLSRKGYSGFVVFDLFLSTGDREARFLEVPFDGQTFSIRSASTVHQPELSEFARSFYRANFEKVDTTILTKPAKFKLRRGLPL